VLEARREAGRGAQGVWVAAGPCTLLSTPARQAAHAQSSKQVMRWAEADGPEQGRRGCARSSPSRRRQWPSQSFREHIDVIDPP